MVKKWNLSEQDKALCIDRLTEQLTVLRVKAGLSQSELVHMVGISRQTYSAAESGHRRLSWEVCLALLFFFEHNPDTREMLHSLGVLPPVLRFDSTKEPCGELLALADALDAQGKHTLLTVLLVEYARCSGQSLAELAERFSILL